MTYSVSRPRHIEVLVLTQRGWSLEQLCRYMPKVPPEEMAELMAGDPAEIDRWYEAEAARIAAEQALHLEELKAQRERHAKWLERDQQSLLGGMRFRKLQALMWSEAGLTGRVIGQRLGVSQSRAAQLVRDGHKIREKLEKRARNQRMALLQDLQELCIARPVRLWAAPTYAEIAA